MVGDTGVIGTERSLTGIMHTEAVHKSSCKSPLAEVGAGGQGTTVMIFQPVNDCGGVPKKKADSSKKEHKSILGIMAFDTTVSASP